MHLLLVPMLASVLHFIDFLSSCLRGWFVNGKSVKSVAKRTHKPQPLSAMDIQSMGRKYN